MNKLYDEMLCRSLKNLGTFSTSYLEDEARKIFISYAPINGIDTYTYPELEEFSNVCKKFILGLTNPQEKAEFRVFSTTGSSEAILLGMYFLKEHWKRFSSPLKKPNVILSSHTHITWKKVAEFLNIHIKLLPISQATLTIDTNLLEQLIDENTIAICCTLGSPTTLCFDDVAKVNKVLEQYDQQYNRYIPIHVDAASGGFVAPFVYPTLDWGFNLAHVCSINISSHKYGLIYPSLGWLLLRKAIYSDAYTTQQDYLGKIIYTYGIRFSHTAAHLAAQHHYIKTKNSNGYQIILDELFSLTKKLKYHLSKIDEITILSPKKTAQLPGVVFTLKAPKLSLQALINKLKAHGWSLPLYLFPYGNKMVATRIVLRYGMNDETIEAFIQDCKETIAILSKSYS